MTIVGIALLVALCIPIVALLVDSPIGRALGARLERRPPPVPGSEATADLEKRLALLEGDVELLQRSVIELREENEFLQRLLEEGRARASLPRDGA
jgi:hypothetical protein